MQISCQLEWYKKKIINYQFINLISYLFLLPFILYDLFDVSTLYVDKF